MHAMFLPIWEVFLLGALLVPLGWILLFLVFGHVVAVLKVMVMMLTCWRRGGGKNFWRSGGIGVVVGKKWKNKGVHNFFVGNKGILFVVRGVRQKIMGCNEKKKNVVR